eukprot:239462_1
MALLLLLSVICISLKLVQGLQIGALVTIRQQHVSSVFLEEEFFGVYNRTKSNIITIMVVIDQKKLVEIEYNKKILSFEITAPDYSKVIEKEFERINNRTIWKPNGKQMLDFFDEFRPWFEYEIFIATILAEYPDLTSISVLGETIQGRNIPIITITPDENFNSNKPGFYIQASVHSNEWLANAATAYILKTLCEGYGNDDAIQYVLNNVNIFIVPTVNIDGYIYTWTGSSARNWRKNRRANEDGTFGVDLNRNYAAGDTWGTVGTSHNPASNNYCGTAQFSEPETQAISQWISNDNYNIQAAVDMHTTGPYILWPLGYTLDRLPQPLFELYNTTGDNMRQAADINGKDYQSIQSSYWYLTSGTMHDFVSMESNFEKLGFTFEGPPIDSSIPPSEVIIPAGQEQLEALLYLARQLI